MPYKACAICGNDFYAKPRHIEMGWAKYCSKNCQNASQRSGKVYPCMVCSKPVYRTNREILKSSDHRFYCGKACFATWKNGQAPTGEDHFNWKNGESAYRNILLRSGSKPICAGCQIDNVRVLVVHHVDRNRKNNRLDNLRWLCRNCHYLEHEGKTF